MKPYRELSKEELLALQAELQAEYDAEKEKDLNLDISRGKPGKEQLDLSMPMMDVLNGETAEDYYIPTNIYNQQFTLRDYFAPIPDGDIIRNPQLVQNPWW